MLQKPHAVHEVPLHYLKVDSGAQHACIAKEPMFFIETSFDNYLELILAQFFRD